MKRSAIVSMLVILLLIASCLFLLFNINLSNAYALEKRLIRLATMTVVGISVAFSSIVFQTLTNNRILTPSIMGYEAVFILFQTLLVFFYGDRALKVINQQENFFIAIILMLGFSMMMYLLMFGKNKKSIYSLLLMGVVFGTLFMTMSQFIHILLDPNEFSVAQNFMFVSFAKMNTKLLSIACSTMLITSLYLLFNAKKLDVMSLGQDHAMNLGIDYHKMVKRFLVCITLLVSVSTALVGPITFLGVLVCNLTYELIKTFKHRSLLLSCALLSCLFLIIGQFLVEHVLSFSTTVSIIINFIGGVYFIYLLWLTRKKIH